MSAGERELPAGWVTVSLDSVAALNLGKMLDRAKRTQGTSMPYLRNINVRWEHFELEDLLEMPFEQHELDRYSLQFGDVAVCEGGEPGRSAVWTLNESIMFQKAIHRVRPSFGIDSRWIVQQLRYDAMSGALEQYFTGTTIKHFTGASLSKYPVQLPPLSEQKRVLTKLDALQARSRRAKEALDAVPKLLERLRQSILASAFRGELTADWRAQHPEVEPASELLKRIRVERRQKWEEAELAKLTAKGKRPKDDAWKAKYQEPAPVDPKGLSELPAGWAWATLDELSSGITYGFTASASSSPVGPRLLRITDIQNDMVKWSDVPYCDCGMPGNYLLQSGDIVVARTGATTGKSYLLNMVPEPSVFASYLIRIQPLNLVLSSCLWLFMRSPRYWAQITVVSKGTAQPGANASILGGLAVPVAPMAEQHLIVKMAEARLTAIDRLGEQLQASIAELGTLDRALLAKAFRGELVPQDLSDEPASVLLERIRQERAAAPAPPKRGRKRAKAEA